MPGFGDSDQIRNKSYGQGTDLSELYYRRPGVALPSVTADCGGTKYTLMDYEDQRCNISHLVVANHGAYEFIGNPLSVVPVYYGQGQKGNIYPF
ncbi:hypothetical protein Q1695_015767 [Nippostrongylus brasiliensis]|nr:hypothetical protein Q1695_015767 [Nippostrongylus brasiliensis]